MLHGSSILASRREERVQKAALVDHHGPGDARLSHSAIGLYGEQSDYVAATSREHCVAPRTWCAKWLVVVPHWAVGVFLSSQLAPTRDIFIPVHA